MPASAGNRSQKLGKQKKLKAKIAFDHLFEHGSSMKVGVLKIFFALDPPMFQGPGTFQVAVAAPKRNFKRAVDRNFLKRRIREAFRLNQHILDQPLQEKGQRIIILFSYRHREKSDFDRIRRSMVKALHMIEQQIVEEKK